MIYLKFPKMEKLLNKATAELMDDDPKKGVCVMMDHAVVLRDRDIVFFNLKDYFLNELDATNEKTVLELTIIMTFMNNKMFTKAFWEELTKGAMVSINNGNMELEGAVRKDLIYEVVTFNPIGIEEYIMKNAGSVPAAVTRKAFYVSSILGLFTTFKTLLKDSSMAIESTGDNTPLRYAFDECPWLWGIMQSDASFMSQHFVFNDLLDINLELKKKHG